MQRGSIAVTVAIDPADQATATAAQMSVGGLSVTLTRDGGTEGPRTATTDASGVVSFSSLLQGRYTLSVIRTLTAAERGGLPANDQEVTLFAGGASVVLGSGQSQTARVELLATRRGSLVISEVFALNATPNAYPYGNYLEIYNNSDTTAYLDGLWVAKSQPQGYHTGTEERPCSSPSNIAIRTDNTRFWAMYVWQIPGSGREFALPPGEAVVIAMDAINHITASGNSRYADLSAATFEQFETDADTDNPTSANLLRIRLPSTGIFGRGHPLGNSVTHVLALPGDATTVDSTTYTGFTFYGIPMSRVLDAFSYGADPAFLEAFPHLPRPCNPWVSPVFDREHYVPHMVETTGALRRKSLGFTEDGREILQRTRNSARDIEAHEGLLRSLRKQ